MHRSGTERFRRAALVLILFACVSTCMPYGFAGGGLPKNIRTVAVLPFDNETAAANLQIDVLNAMRAGIERRLGLRDAPEARADAVVRGRLVRCDADIPDAYSSDPTRVTSARRRLQITADIEIVDQTSGKTLWTRKGLSAEGSYAEQAEADGRKQAIDKLVSAVVDGAQSQW
ncbi:MAG: hypothetical protein ABJD07_15600 [Gemmatimonadaceae bacterium]